MAAHTWELDRDIALAHWAGDKALVQRLEAALSAARAECSHYPNPEKQERCYKCGAGLERYPGLKKVNPDESIPRTGPR